MCEQVEVEDTGKAEDEPLCTTGVHEATAALSVLAEMSSEAKDKILLQVRHSLRQ
jgi:hypothetical protein